MKHLVDGTVLFFFSLCNHILCLWKSSKKKTRVIIFLSPYSANYRSIHFTYKIPFHLLEHDTQLMCPAYEITRKKIQSWDKKNRTSILCSSTMNIQQLLSIQFNSNATSCRSCKTCSIEFRAKTFVSFYMCIHTIKATLIHASTSSELVNFFFSRFKSILYS